MDKIQRRCTCFALVSLYGPVLRHSFSPPLLCLSSFSLAQSYVSITIPHSRASKVSKMEQDFLLMVKNKIPNL